jgi:hypothetical protein
MPLNEEYISFFLTHISFIHTHTCVCILYTYKTYSKFILFIYLFVFM